MDRDAVVDALLTEARVGCWCQPYRKPCEFHQGFEDGLDMMADLAELQKAAG